MVRSDLHDSFDSVQKRLGHGPTCLALNDLRVVRVPSVSLLRDRRTRPGVVRDALRQWAAKHARTDTKLIGDVTAVTRCA